MTSCIMNITTLCENEMTSMSRAWDTEKIWVPERIRTYDLPNIGWALYPLELRRTHGDFKLKNEIWNFLLNFNLSQW